MVAIIIIAIIVSMLFAVFFDNIIGIVLSLTIIIGVLIYELKLIPETSKIKIELESMGYNVKSGGYFNRLLNGPTFFAFKDCYKLQINPLLRPDSKEFNLHLDFRIHMNFPQEFKIIKENRSVEQIHESIVESKLVENFNSQLIKNGTKSNTIRERITLTELQKIFELGDDRTKIFQKNNLMRIEINFKKQDFSKIIPQLEKLAYLAKFNTAGKISDKILHIGLDYRCSDCNREITLEGNRCPYCLAIAPVCIICYADPEPLEEISVLICCQSYAHTKHLDQWLLDNNQCPYCNIEGPLMFDVTNLELNK